MFGPKKPSRVLNDARFVLGLSLLDFGIVVTCFVVVARLLNESAFAPLSFVVAVVCGAAMIPLRIKHRDHFLRDVIGWILCRGKF